MQQKAGYPSLGVSGISPLYRRRRLRVAAAAALALLLLALTVHWLFLRPGPHPDSARYTGRAEALPLVDGLASYATVADVCAALDARAIAWRRRRIARPPDPRYPPRALDTLTVERHALFGQNGRLTLEFFNDRLYEAGFEPDDPAAFAPLLKRAEAPLTRDRNARWERLDGPRRVVSNVEFAASPVGRSLTTRPYALWQDLRLVRERDDWDERFGGIAYSAE